MSLSHIGRAGISFLGRRSIDVVEVLFAAHTIKGTGGKGTLITYPKCPMCPILI